VKLLDRKQSGSLQPHFVWTGSEGTLLWTLLKMADADDDETAKPVFRLVLLDSYDRLVAMEDGPWTRWVLRKSAGKIKPFSRTKLHIYDGYPEALVAEIVMSYVAICAQLTRRGAWDDYGRIGSS
jgi:hypothetical protein